MTKEETLRLALDTLKEVREETFRLMRNGEKVSSRTSFSEETFRLMRNGEKLYSEDKVWSTIITIQEALETKDEKKE